MEISFTEGKQKVINGISNKEFFDDCKELMSEYSNVLVIGVSPEGQLDTYYTQNSTLELLGMLKIAEQQIIDETRI